MDGDTDAAFVAEANIDAKDSNAMASEYHPDPFIGEESTTAARGGVAIHVAAPDGLEDDPLVSGHADDSDHDDSRSAHERTGVDDFRHLPWYKQPSVSHNGADVQMHH